MSENRGVPVYPNNSNKVKEQAEKNPVLSQENRTEKVVTSPVTTKKPTLSKKIMDNIFDGSIEERLTNAVFDILIPSAKKMFCDAVLDLVSMTLTGKPLKDRNVRSSGSTTIRTNQTPYNSLYDYNASTRPRQDAYDRRVSIDDIVVGSEEEAKSVCGKMMSILGLYGNVTVADLYSSVGLLATYTEQHWGWKSFPRGYPSYEQVPEGYLLIFPRVEPV